jgi:phosphoserine/homoserine phosphotransferase
MQQLDYPTLFCHNLEIDPSGKITNYKLRLPDQKHESVLRLKDLKFKIIAAGDSYNDTTMLAAAHRGILFRPPPNVVQEFPQFPVTQTYPELMQAFQSARHELKER